jgi:hypothetical protein
MRPAGSSAGGFFFVRKRQSRLRVMRISGCGLASLNGCLTAAVVLNYERTEATDTSNLAVTPAGMFALSIHISGNLCFLVRLDRLAQVLPSLMESVAA